MCSQATSKYSEFFDARFVFFDQKTALKLDHKDVWFLNKVHRKPAYEFVTEQAGVEYE